MFDKGYTPNWSEEIFIVQEREPVYLLRDFNGENVTGSFYKPELQRVREPSEYRVEKVIRSRKIRGGEKEYQVERLRQIIQLVGKGERHS